MTDQGQGVATIPSDRQAGVRIDVQALTRKIRTKDRRQLTLLDAASFSVAPGELVAIVGGSGTGKTTLLEAMVGVTPATSGCVCFDGADLYSNLRTYRSVLGFVPQDDIIHVDLPLEHTLRYAAWLRLPPSTTDADVDTAVADAMAAVDLTAHACRATSCTRATSSARSHSIPRSPTPALPLTTGPVRRSSCSRQARW